MFTALQEIGGIDTREIYQTFNMSMGFAMVAPAEDAEEIVKTNRNAHIVGRVQKGDGVLYAPENILYDHY